MARDPPNQGRNSFRAVVAIATAAAVTIALVAASLFISGAGFFVVLFFAFFNISFFFVCFVVSVDVPDGDDVEASRGVVIASHGTQLPAVALAQIRQLPAAEVDDGGRATVGGDDECVVCLGMVEGDGLPTRKLAACRHVFHKHCIEQWLRAHPTCPVCRSNARQESLEVILRLNT